MLPLRAGTAGQESPRGTERPMCGGVHPACRYGTLRGCLKINLLIFNDKKSGFLVV